MRLAFGLKVGEVANRRQAMLSCVYSYVCRCLISFLAHFCLYLFSLSMIISSSSWMYLCICACLFLSLSLSLSPLDAWYGFSLLPFDYINKYKQVWFLSSPLLHARLFFLLQFFLFLRKFFLKGFFFILNIIIFFISSTSIWLHHSLQSSKLLSTSLSSSIVWKFK